MTHETIYRRQTTVRANKQRHGAWVAMKINMRTTPKSNHQTYSDALGHKKDHRTTKIKPSVHRAMDVGPRVSTLRVDVMDTNSSGDQYRGRGYDMLAHGC